MLQALKGVCGDAFRGAWPRTIEVLFSKRVCVWRDALFIMRNSKASVGTAVERREEK